MNIKMTNKIEFLNTPSKENPFLVISKPSGLPTAPLSAQDTNNALYLAAQTFPEILSVNGKKEIEHGLIHRIDTVTEGLILIATTQNAYENFINQQKSNIFTKYYTAICQKNQKLKDMEKSIRKYSDEIFIDTIYNKKLNKELLITISESSSTKVKIFEETRGLNEIASISYSPWGGRIFLSAFCVDSNFQKNGIGRFYLILC